MGFILVFLPFNRREGAELREEFSDIGPSKSPLT